MGEMERKVYEEAQWKSAEVDEATLARINQFARVPLQAEEVLVRRMDLANDHLDRDNERFSEAVLKDFAASLPGKSFLVGHEHSRAPVARFFDAAVEERPDGKHLAASIYALKRNDGGLKDQVDAGIYHDVSIGFRAASLTCDICGENMRTTACSHYPGKDYDGQQATGTWQGPAEALEGSVVWLGSQIGASFTKSAPTADGEKIWEDPEGGEWIHHQLHPSDAFVRVRTMWLSEKDQIQARVGPLKSDPGGGTKVQSLLFKKPKWTLEKAKAWMREHPDVGKALQDAVQIAMAVVLGARSGVRGSKSVYDELAAQYRELGEEPPEWKPYTQNVLRKLFGGVWATVKAQHEAGDEMEVAELEAKVAELEEANKKTTEEVASLKAAAAEAVVLRADLIGDIVGKATITGNAALYTADLLAPMPAQRLKEIQAELGKKFDEKFPPSGQIPVEPAETKQKQADYSAFQV